MLKTILLFLTLTQMGYAADWYCHDVGAERFGNTWRVCGVGMSTVLPESQLASLNIAMMEFKKYCELDTECSKGNKHVEPKRLECTENSMLTWTCYRLIVVTVY